MGSSEGFKVIIAGGGVAGLTLANMLEKFDIDYLVLESHSAIAPAVGASIGLFPNGLRILDQIGCYDPITDLALEDTKLGYNRHSDGTVMSTMHNFSAHLTKRHGYPLLFFDRQWLLQVLYDQLKHKERVLVNKRVSKIESLAGEVKVITADGDHFNGSILIGADGVHSSVRGEMFRLGHELQPGHFSPDQEQKVPVYYKCSFGIAQNVPGFQRGSQHWVAGKGTAQLVVSGPEDRVYWFLFVKLPETKWGKDIPKYTKEDEAQFVKEHINLPITEDITFGQVYAKRLSSTLTPLHEVVYDKWFFRRVMIVGDAAHKPNPIGGQGGNGAIETCAELVNSLLEARDCRKAGLTGLTDQDIDDIFSKTQARRHDRAKRIVKVAHLHQALLAYENPLFSGVIMNLVQPFVGEDFALSTVGGTMTDSASIRKLPIPKRARVIPYKDEAPAKPAGKIASNISKIGVVGVMTGLVVATGFAFRQLPILRVSGWGNQEPITRTWTGHTQVDTFLNFCVSLFSHVLLDRDPTTILQSVYFLTQLISPILIYTIEGHRIGNKGSPLALPSIYAFGMQVMGIWRIAPVWAALHALLGDESPAGRFIRPEVADALVPALSLGYVIPTILMLAPTSDTRSWQNWTLLWQFAPPLVPFLTSIFSKGLRWWQRSRPSQPKVKAAENTEGFERYEPTDIPDLKFAYKYAFLAQATVHISTGLYMYSSGVSFWSTFFNVPNIFKPSWEFQDNFSLISTFFKFDHLFSTVATVTSNLYTAWSLRRAGYVTTAEAVKAAMGVVAGQFLVGTGATWAGLWHWRETVLARLGQ